MEIGSISGGWIVERVLGSSNRHTTAVWKQKQKNSSYVASGPISPENLVVKMCRLPPEGLTERQRHSWRDQLSLLYKINHKNIVRIINLPSDLTVNLTPHNLSGLPVLCMEYCSLGDLRYLLSRPENSHGLSEINVRTVLSDIKSAVEYLHSMRIVHKDLKPETIALHPSDDGRPFVCKLTDLGVMKDLDSSLSSLCSQYSAPELIYSKSCSNTADYWSFGLIAFEIICGFRPFLPNMAPVQWMTHVKTKSHQNICIFENADGKIEYADSLFEENCITKRFKVSIEKWLQSALEWDPEKRGLCENEDFNSDDNGFFKRLDEILAKKILTVFSVPTYEILSYEIDQNTLFSTLRSWIEHDTKVNIVDQIYLSIDGNTFEKNEYALTAWNQRLEIMLNLYEKNKTINDNIKINPSSKIYKYLEKPKIIMTYNHLLRTYIEVHSFISNEYILYDLLMKAFILKLKSIKNEIEVLTKSFNESEKDICKLNEKFVLLSAIVTSDKTHLESMKCNDSNTFIKDIMNWLDSVKPVQENIIKLKDAWNQLSARLESVSRRCVAVHDSDDKWKENSCELLKLEKQALQLITTLKSLNKEEKNRNRTPIDAVKLLYKCFKLRDLLLYGSDNKKNIQKILDVDIETHKMGTLIISAGKNATILSGNITALLMEKESFMWKTIKGMNLCISNGIEETKKSITDFKIGQPVRGPVTSSAPDTSTELVSLINDSKKLCMISEDFISRSYKKHKIIQEEFLSTFKTE